MCMYAVLVLVTSFLFPRIQDIETHVCPGLTNSLSIYLSTGRSFWCAMVAATTLKFLDPFGSGKIVLFQVAYGMFLLASGEITLSVTCLLDRSLGFCIDNDWRFWELIPFVFIGLVMGVYGAVFAKLNILWSKRVRAGTWLRAHPIVEVACVRIVHLPCYPFLSYVPTTI